MLLVFLCEKRRIGMEKGNKMREMPVRKLMVQMGIPMILSMAL